MSKHHFISLLLFMPCLALATTYTAKNPPPHTFTMYCPAPSALIKNTKKMTWHTSNNEFKSFQQSFAVDIAKFLGAQWEGINFGKIICLYQGANKDTFPIQLHYEIVTITPTSGNWKAQKGHYSNCVSNSTKDCPFWVREKPKSQNLDAVVKNLKSQPVTNPYQDQEP